MNKRININDLNKNRIKQAIDNLTRFHIDKMKVFTVNLDNDLDIVLQLIEKQQAEIEDLKKSVDYTYEAYQDAGKKMFDYAEEIEKKDNAVRNIIARLENDIKRITETKAKKSEGLNYLDDYTRNRLQAYKTKTKEIKEYIEKQYFERKIEQ